MMKYLYRLFFFTGFLYNAILWNEQLKNESEMNIVSRKVVFIDCNFSKSSSIKVNHKDGFIRVGIPRRICRKLKLGDQIKLVYLSKMNTYSYPGSKSNRNIMILFITLFILSFINLEKLKP